MPGTIEIPYAGGEDEVIEIDTDRLPEGNEGLVILRDNNAQLHFWITLAVSCQIVVCLISITKST